MKTSLKIFLLAVALIVMNGCSAQKRAERHIRKAVALCPDLVQLKAHPIDTVLTVPGFADVTTVPMEAVLRYDTIYAATDHGTVVVSLSQSDSSLRVGFVAVPQRIRYLDTVQLQQVVVEEKPKTASNRGLWEGVVFLLLGFGIGTWVIIYLFRTNPQKP